MDFFTPSWKKHITDRHTKMRFSVIDLTYTVTLSLRLYLALCLALSSLLGSTSALADPAVPEFTTFELERTEEALSLSTVLRFELPSVVDDVLQKGIPVYFVAQAEVRKDRWYWYDKRIATTERHLRLAFQPLLRRWRLQVGNAPIGNNGLGVTLSQNFESKGDALAAIQRFSRWKIAVAGDLEAEGKYHVDFQFRLDVTQLPRPFQIGALGQSDWSLIATRQHRVPMETSK